MQKFNILLYSMERVGLASDQSKTLIERFKKATAEANQCRKNQQYQQAMALYYDASQSADELTDRFLTLLVKTAPSNAHRILIVEFLSWRLRYFTMQYDYHLAVAQTLSGLPREEWLARLETILVLSQTLVSKLLNILSNVDDLSIHIRIRELLKDWVRGIRDLVEDLQSWGMSSAQASRVLEWAFDNGIVYTKP